MPQSAAAIKAIMPCGAITGQSIVAPQTINNLNTYTVTALAIAMAHATNLCAVNDACTTAYPVTSTLPNQWYRVL